MCDYSYRYFNYTLSAAFTQEKFNAFNIRQTFLNKFLKCLDKTQKYSIITLVPSN